MNKKNILLSVIIPCKNEAKNIERCLSSFMPELSKITGFEVLLVDSRSNDQSVEIAKKFPIRIIQLKEHWDISPGAARYVGCLYTSGKYRFFIDADMQLIPGFLSQAIDFLETNQQAAGVAGRGTEYYSEGGKLENMYKRPQHIAQVDLLAGAALFKSQALEKVGYFNPFLKAEEEHELAQRLLKAEYKLFSLPIEMINHYTSKAMGNFERRLKAGMYKGIGQMFRLCLESNTFSFKYFMRFKLLISFIAVLIYAIGAIAVFLNTGNKILIQGLRGLIVFILLFSCYSKRSIKLGILSIYKTILINIHIIIGLFTKTSDISKYPKDVIIIKNEGT